MQVVICGEGGGKSRFLQMLQTACKKGTLEGYDAVLDGDEVDVEAIKDDAEYYIVVVNERTDIPVVKHLQEMMEKCEAFSTNVISIKDYFLTGYCDYDRSWASFSTPPKKSDMKRSGYKENQFRDVRRNMRMTKAHFGRR